MVWVASRPASSSRMSCARDDGSGGELFPGEPDFPGRKVFSGRSIHPHQLFRFLPSLQHRSQSIPLSDAVVVVV